MSTDAAPTISTAPPPYLAMDHARLRAEGIRLLGRLAGEQWTDFNTHDPGITILEQLCHAITDLGYRTAFPVAELVSGVQGTVLPPAEAVLGCHPVTLDDLRRAALDVEGVANAWVAMRDTPELPVYHHAASGSIHLQPEVGRSDAPPIVIVGLYGVQIRFTDGAGPPTRAQVSRRLHAGRPLGQDVDVGATRDFTVRIDAEIEVLPTEDPAGLAAAIRSRIDAHLAPAGEFVPLERALAGGHRIDELLQGPALAHGVLLSLAEPPTAVNVSDLVHAILDVPGTRAVRTLTLPGGGWSLPIPPGQPARLDAESPIVLLRDGRRLRFDPRAGAAPTQAQRRVEPSSTAVRRPRALGHHTSIRHQLPAVYGVGPLGLARSASMHRRAQAKQLEGYLLIFDQLLANAFAQLEHAPELLGAGDGIHGYFSAPVFDPELHPETLVRDADDYPAWLERAVEPGDPRPRQRAMLDHLLARFAEAQDDGAHAEPDDGAQLADGVAERRSFLRDYPRIGTGRGSGIDLLRTDDEDARTGFVDRLRHKLGLRTHPAFFVVEHVLLRPIAEDSGQKVDDGQDEVPLLAGVSDADPWSLQITVVLRGVVGPDDDHAEFIQQTIAHETPAHLAVRVFWREDDEEGADWTEVEQAWRAFEALLRQQRRRAAELDPDPSDEPVPLHLRLRDARDRLVELLELGLTYPLRDVPVTEHVVVAPGAPATITVAFSQRDVRYELRDRVTQAPIEAGGLPIVVVGTGGPIEIPVPPVVDDATYRILAVKPGDAPRATWLRAMVRLEESVDRRLEARISLPLLDASIDLPRPTDARIGDDGVEAEVEVVASQEGVVYELIADAPDLGDYAAHRVLSGEVVGTSGTIVLRTSPMHEDVDLRVRGRKSVGEPPQVRQAVLDVVLPLRVRARCSLAIELPLAVVDHEQPATLRLTDTQASVSYRVWTRAAKAYEFRFDDAPGVPTIDVDAGAQIVRLERPPLPNRWEDLDFVPVGAAASGNGSQLDLVIDGRDADALVLVQATKLHRVGPLLGSNPAVIASAVQLERAAALLVRPNPRQPLRLDAALVAGSTTGPLSVRDGESGVYYSLFVDGAADPIASPAYFHARDDDDSGLNRGIAIDVAAPANPHGLHVGIDFAIARDPAPADPMRDAPSPPVLDAPSLPVGTVLRVRARRALTGLEVALDRPAVIDPMPPTRVEGLPLVPGASAGIIVEPSVAGEFYWLERAGVAGSPSEGNGGALRLDTGPCNETTTFVLVAALIDGDTLPVLRRIEVEVVVQG